MAKKTNDGGAAEVQDKFDEANDKGFFGNRVDPTPDENYTVAGVTKGKPTPETDDEAAAAAKAASGVGEDGE